MQLYLDWLVIAVEQNVLEFMNKMSSGDKEEYLPMVFMPGFCFFSLIPVHHKRFRWGENVACI